MLKKKTRRTGTELLMRTNGVRLNGKELPLRSHTEHALNDYFSSLNGHRPARVYDMVLREVEEPLFRAVLDYAAGCWRRDRSSRSGLRTAMQATMKAGSSPTMPRRWRRPRC